MQEKPNPCPRCASEMKIITAGGSMRTWPSITLKCSNIKCWWNMSIEYDELSGMTSGDILPRFIKQWNEGTSKQLADVLDDVQNHE